MVKKISYHVPDIYGSDRRAARSNSICSGIRNTDIAGIDHLYARKHTSGSGDLLVCQTGFDVGKRQKIYRKIFYMVYSEG